MTKEDKLVERITKITKIALGDGPNKDFNEAILQAAVKAAKVGYSFAVDEAAEWLHTALYLDHERSIEHRYATLEELLCDFRKAMKGD